MAQKQCFRLLGLLVLLLPVHPHTAHPAAKSEEARPHTDADRGGFIWPVHGSVISSFGSPRFSGRHSGVDIKAPGGTPIRAPAPAIATFSGPHASSGPMLQL